GVATCLVASVCQHPNRDRRGACNRRFNDATAEQRGANRDVGHEPYDQSHGVLLLREWENARLWRLSLLHSAGSASAGHCCAAAATVRQQPVWDCSQEFQHWATRRLALVPTVVNALAFLPRHPECTAGRGRHGLIGDLWQLGEHAETTRRLHQRCQSVDAPAPALSNRAPLSADVY